MIGAAGVVGAPAAGAQAPPDCSLAVHVSAGEERYVCRLYTDLLLRRSVPTDPELAHWVGQLRTVGRSAVTRALTHSDESYRALIRSAYTELLLRAGDSGGIAYWVDLLRRGLPLEVVEGVMVSSAEGFQAQGGSDNRQFAEAIFDLYLGRPASQGEADHFASLIVARGNNESGRAQTVIDIITSAEGRNRNANGLYVYWLDRRADPGGQQHWAEQLRTRGYLEVVADFIATDEAFNVLGR
ncbi:MAG: hypothetical protein H0W25_17130 [Acidimicrobiia bacterium]|nr:hypothetical protein [Acidimicrobiia bacterium]